MSQKNQSPSYAQLEKVLRKLSLAAGRSLEKSYQNFKRQDARLKGRRDLVTPADLKSNALIIEGLKKNFPGHQILSEESGRNQKTSEYLWIVDPLDGTTNFYIHNPLWAVSVALAYRGQIIMGAVYAPLLKEFYFAAAGQGAYLNGRRLQIPSASETKAAKKINAYCHGSGLGNIKKALKYHHYQKTHSLDCRQLGSAAIEAAYVATGRLASLLIPGTWPWDVAAGALIVREAGGLVSDFKGRPWQISEKNFLAAGPKEHSEILKIIKKIKL